MNQSKFSSNFITQKSLIIALLITFLMLLTRGSHVLTRMSLPDASLALLFIGGLYLRKLTWFVWFVALATSIDFVSAMIDSTQAFCLTSGYWGMLPTYAIMWLAGLWLSKQKNSLEVLKYSISSLMATFSAFVISTQTYYLFSGRFPNNGINETIHYGWEYLSSYMGFTAAYLVGFWMLAKVLTKVNGSFKTTSTNIS